MTWIPSEERSPIMIGGTDGEGDRACFKSFLFFSTFFPLFFPFLLPVFIVTTRWGLV